MYHDSWIRTVRSGHSDQDSRGSGQPEQDSQAGTSRTGQSERDNQKTRVKLVFSKNRSTIQNRGAGKGAAEQNFQSRTARNRQPRQESEVRKARAGLPSSGPDCQDRIARTGNLQQVGHDGQNSQYVENRIRQLDRTGWSRQDSRFSALTPAIFKSWCSL